MLQCCGFRPSAQVQDADTPCLLLSLGVMGWQPASAAHARKEHDNWTGSRDVEW